MTYVNYENILRIKNKMKICFIVPYYGKFPNWFPFFLKSCEYNKEIDWLFFTDIDYTGKLPLNVKFLEMSFQKYKQAASQKLNCKVNGGVRKLCDHKPLYGFLFEDYLKEYDYWGWCDVDLIFGNLTKYVDKCSGGYECISFAEEPQAFPYGPCTLIKNCERMNKLFMKSRDLGKILESDRYFGFDEDWSNNVHDIGNIMHDEGVDFFRTNVGNDDSKLRLGAPRPRKNRVGVRRNWSVTWDSGRLFRRNRELMFFHFFRTKSTIDESFNFDEVCKNNNKILFGSKTLKGLG